MDYTFFKELLGVREEVEHILRHGGDDQGGHFRVVALALLHIVDTDGEEELATIEGAVLTALDGDRLNGLHDTDVAIRDEHPHILVERINIGTGESLFGLVDSLDGDEGVDSLDGSADEGLKAGLEDFVRLDAGVGGLGGGITRREERHTDNGEDGAMAEALLQVVDVHLEMTADALVTGNLDDIGEVLHGVGGSTLVRGDVGGGSPPTGGAGQGGLVLRRDVVVDDDVLDTLRVVARVDGELTGGHGLMTLIGQGVGVATDEVVNGNEQLLVGDFRNLGCGGGTTILNELHLAEFVLIEILDLFHSGDFPSVTLESRSAVRQGGGVEVVVLSGGVEANLTECLLKCKVRLHKRLEHETVKLQVVVLEGEGVVEEGLDALAGAKGAGEEVVELNVVGIHSVFSYSLMG